jgi:hypothetical protein
MTRSSNKSVQSIQRFMAANCVISEGLFRWRCTDTSSGIPSATRVGLHSFSGGGEF